MAAVHISEILNSLIADMDSGKYCPCRFGILPDRGDSVLETSFWHMLRKTKSGWHGAVDQFQIGRFRVDCLIDCGGKAVVVELDGKRYHDAMDDELRDAELLQSVDAIIRIPFAALWYYRYATFTILSQWFPRFTVPENICVLSLDQYQEELRNLRPEDDHEDYYFESDASYNIWEKLGDTALVGSASAFRGLNNLRHRIWIQRGTPDPGILSSLYQKTRCRREAAAT